MAPSKQGAPEVALNATDESLEKLFIGLVGAAIIVVETILLLTGVFWIFETEPCSSACLVILTADRTSLGSGDGDDAGAAAMQLACIDAAALVQVVPCEV